MTTIHIDEKNWKKLNRMKNPGESMNDVVTRILKANTFKKKKIGEKEFNSFLSEFMEVQDSINPSIEEITEGFKQSFKGA